MLAQFLASIKNPSEVTWPAVFQIKREKEKRGKRKITRPHLHWIFVSFSSKSHKSQWTLPNVHARSL
jgi:hypothetical protein